MALGHDHGVNHIQDGETISQEPIVSDYQLLPLPADSPAVATLELRRPRRKDKSLICGNRTPYYGYTSSS
ncbi:hypothetical protein LX32DRAFT_638945, partial [Colletotrichum zoysiae]